MTTNHTVQHQVPEGLLAAYAAGALPEAFNLVIATHVSLCDEARVRLGALEAVGGALIEDDPGIGMSHGALQATLRLISERPKDPIKTVTVHEKDDVLPEPLARHLGHGLADVGWRSLGKGAKQAILDSSKDASVRLLYIPGGVEMPDHGHHGTELTLVLQGAFLDGEDRFARGDIEVAGAEDEHQPVAETGEPCICLTATDAKLRFSGLLPKIAQPFFRI